MADRKISDLTALTAPAAGDYLPIVDISEAAAANKNKRITIEELFRGIPLGTAAAPSIAIEGDENTGIYSPGADQLAISTGGTGRLFVDASGNVGVGTAPSARFHVSQAGNTEVSIGGTSTPILSLIGGAATDPVFGYANGALRFGTVTGYAAAGFTERLRLTSTGALNFVGAGTAGSTQAVSFNGSAPINSLVIDSSGRLLVGTSSSLVSSSLIQVAGNSYPAISINSFGSASSPEYFFNSARGTSGTPTVSADGDKLGAMYFRGYDGSEYLVGAKIEAFVDGAVTGGGADDLPGRLVFSTTADGVGSPTERMRITSTGQVRLAGAGITFNGDTAAANELDDYEEGTFTPTIVGSTTAGTATYSTQTGIYTKVGRKVTVVVYLNWSSGTGAGNLQVSGLPFTALGNAGYYYSVVFGLVDNIALTAANVITGYVSQNTTIVTIGQTPSGGGAYSVVPYDAAGHFMFSCTYFA